MKKSKTKSKTKSKKISAAQNPSRRKFIQSSAIATTALMAGCSPKVADNLSTAPATGAVLGANDRMVCGFIGVGGQGYNSHLLNTINRNEDGSQRHEYTYNAVGAAACDVFSKRRDRAQVALEGARAASGSDAQVAVYDDYRAMLDRQDIDAIFIGTVDHWHAQIAIDAMDAGKHVYCEKPMTRYLGEAFDIYDEVIRTGMTFQVGSQYCTEGKWHKAAELISSGAIGPMVLCQDSFMRNNPDGEWNYYELEPELDPNSTLDWQQWLGPVSDRDFDPQHYHRWRKYYPYCAGLLGDLLAHRIHPLLIATGNPEYPTRVACVGNKVIGDMQMGPEDRDVTTVTQVIAEFQSGLNMIVTGCSVNEQGHEQIFRGQEATILFSGNTLEVRPERPFADLVDQQRFENIEPGVSIPAHIDDFFGAIRDDRMPNGNIELAMRTQVIISMAEMSERMGLMLYYDQDNRKITTKDGKEIEAITYGTLDPS